MKQVGLQSSLTRKQATAAMEELIRLTLRPVPMVSPKTKTWLLELRDLRAVRWTEFF